MREHKRVWVLAVLLLAARVEAGPREAVLVQPELLADGRVRLHFPPLEAEPALERFTAEEAREVLAKFHEGLRAQGMKVPEARAKPASDLLLARDKLLPAVVCGVAVAGACTSGVPRNQQPEEWEKQLRAAYIEKYGEPLVPLPKVLEGSPLFLALKLAPKYMPEGVREGMQVLVEDKVFLVSMVLTVGLYIVAWTNPEPVFSKAAAAAVTWALVLAYGVGEMVHTGVVFWNLYQDTKGERSLEEVERAAERLGKAVGGKLLRAVLFAVSAGAAKGVPPGALGGWMGRLAPARYAVAGGGSVSVVPGWVQVVDGKVVLGGAAAVAMVAAVKATAAGPACKTEQEERDKSYQRHHLASDKNEISTNQGGPWTPRFEELFARAGMSLDDPENIVYLKNHKGPHPLEYHQEVFERIQRALAKCQGPAQCRSKVTEALKAIAKEVCSPGSPLHRLITKSP